MRRKSHRAYLVKAGKKVCYYCGLKMTPREITADHRIPLSRDGYDRRKNVVACCFYCNNLKGSMLPDEFVMSERFTDPESPLNRLRQTHPGRYDLAKAHGHVPMMLIQT